MEEIARIYAESLFEAAQDHGKIDEVKTELEQFAQAVNDSADLALFLFSPYFSGEEKSAGLTKIVDQASTEFVNFLRLLAEKHRLPAIHRINAQYQELWSEHHKLLPVTVTSAVELPQETIDKIASNVEAQTGRTVVLDGRVDDSVIGGIVVQVGNMVLDASIRGRLEKLSKQVSKAA